MLSPLLTTLQLGHQAPLGLDKRRGHHSPRPHTPRALVKGLLPPQPCRCELTADMHHRIMSPCLGRWPASLLTGHRPGTLTCSGMHTLSCSWVKQSPHMHFQTHNRCWQCIW